MAEGLTAPDHGCILINDNLISINDNDRTWIAVVGFGLLPSSPALACAAVVVGAVVVTALGVAGLAGWSDYHLTVSIPVESAADLEPDRARLFYERTDPKDASAVIDADAEVQVESIGPLGGPARLEAEPGWSATMAWAHGALVVALAAGATLLYQLTLLLRSAAAGEPFAAGAVRRIRIVGSEVGSAVASTGTLPADLGFEYRGPLLLGPANDVTVDVGTVLAGLLVLLLAEVFAHGQVLAREQRLTI
ncbi:hypothetical protein BH23ACT10_BH23ACT10_30980 [soil metagenome]